MEQQLNYWYTRLHPFWDTPATPPKFVAIANRIGVERGTYSSYRRYDFKWIRKVYISRRMNSSSFLNTRCASIRETDGGCVGSCFNGCSCVMYLDDGKIHLRTLRRTEEAVLRVDVNDE